MQLPSAFLQGLEKKLGVNVNDFKQSMDASTPVSIRLNPFKPIDDFDGMEQVPWHPLGRYLPKRPVFTLDPLFHAGTYYVQEASSMAIYQALRQAVNLDKKLNVLDLCASPGGKSTLLASAISPDSFLLANEVIKSRIDPLRQNLLKWGNSNYMISNHDSEDFAGLNGFFDVVLVDAPCSGEGLFRKAPRTINEWSLEQVKHCSARQKRILTEAKKLVKEGGTLIYSTCTYNENENDRNMEWLLEEGSFEPFHLKLPIEWGIVETDFGHQFYPNFLKGEGFYLGVLRKIGNGRETLVKTRVKKKWPRLAKKEKALIDPWISNSECFSFFKKPNNEIAAVPSGLEELFLIVATSLKRRSFGTHIGTVKQNKLIPAHGFALSHFIHEDVECIQLGLESTLHFLKKENFELNTKEKGWKLVRYKGHNLGWVKLLGNRFNNYFPNDWRIRRF